jgi:hypothetical protein
MSMRISGFRHRAKDLLLVAALLVGCTKANPDYCEKAGDCTGGRVCNVEWSQCVLPDAAVGPLDALTGTDDGPAAAVDQPFGRDMGAPLDSPAVYDSTVDAPTTDVTKDLPGPDTRIPDAAGTCGTNLDCTDPAKAFCVAGVCVGCQSAGAGACVAPTSACDLSSGKCVGCLTDSQCTTDPAKGFCVAGSCVGCGVAGATGCSARTDGKTTCATTGTATGQCVECTGDAQCTTSPAKGFCVANACTGCNTTGATGCSIRPDGKTVCGSTTSTAAGQCVECNVDSDCKTASKGFCVANACTGCNTAGATGCSGRTDGKTTCATTGTAAGQCVECTGDAQCTTSPAKGFCVANACTGCNTTGATGCSGRTDGKTVCSSTGTLAGQCVACVASSDCKVATAPICTSNVCGACTADSQCSAKLGTTGNPGVCMNNIDGHCAVDSETVYVGTIGTATCSDTVTGAGSAATPFCSLQKGVNNAKANSKGVVAVTGTLAQGSATLSPASPLTIVGKSTATITPDTASDGITITSGTVYLRSITVQGVTTTGSQTGIGINATSGATLYMSGCKVTNNPGGGVLLNGSAFDIENTTVTGNGPGQLGVATWGGILVNSLPASGPTTLNLVTIQNNNPVGISCSGTTSGTGVLATSNLSTQITSSCGFTSCISASTTCGAQ